MTAMVMVVVAVIVAPGPIFFLFFRRQAAKIPVPVVVCLFGPAVVVDDLVIIPNVVVGVIRIVDANVMMFAGDASQ